MVFMLRMVFVARFLKVLLQLLLRVAAALAHGTYLLGRRCSVRVLVRAVIGRVWFLAHSGIVPPEVHIRKQCPRLESWRDYCAGTETPGTTPDTTSPGEPGRSVGNAHGAEFDPAVESGRTGKGFP